MIELKQDTHEYFDGEKKLISVTQLMRKHGLATDYSGVTDGVLAAKAERGTLIHKEIENYVDSGEIGFTGECAEFADYCRDNQIVPWFSEEIVGNDIVAGTVDFIYSVNGVMVLADFKTTSVLHKDAVAWQLSIYKALCGHQIDKLQAFHFSEDGLKVIDIREKPAGEVERLFQCERDGVPYVQSVTISEASLVELTEVENLIKQIEAQKKEAESKAAKLREAIMTAMKDNGLTSFDTDQIRITYVAPFTRSSVDSTRLKNEMPDVYEKYVKQSTVKESLKITVKEDKQ